MPPTSYYFLKLLLLKTFCQPSHIHKVFGLSTPPTTTDTFMRDIHAEQEAKGNQVPHKIQDIRLFTGSGMTSAPPFQ